MARLLQLHLASLSGHQERGAGRSRYQLIPRRVLSSHGRARRGGRTRARLRRGPVCSRLRARAAGKGATRPATPQVTCKQTPEERHTMSRTALRRRAGLAVTARKHDINLEPRQEPEAGTAWLLPADIGHVERGSLEEA